MTIDTTTPRSRRKLLAGLVGTLAAAAATTLGRVQPAAAHDADDVRLGGSNSAIIITSITNTATNGTAFEGIGTGFGEGVFGLSDSGAGVYGSSSSGIAVQADSTSGYGVFSDSGSATLPAAVGRSLSNNTGVQGYSGTDSPPASPAKTGVYGYADQDAGARGVTGESTSGRGVNGIATSGTGVRGASTTGEGVRGVSSGSNGVAGTSASGVASGVYGENTAGGAGIYGRSSSGTGNGAFGESISGTGVQGATTSGVGGLFSAGATGTALSAQGRVQFSTAGLTSLAAGAKSRSITPGTNLVTGSLVLCTLESNQSGLTIQRVTKDTSLNTFKVYLSVAVASGKSAKVAWFVIG
jgi:hypothetical protein